MALIEVEEKIAAALQAQADLRAMTLEAFLKRIAEAAAPVNSSPTMSLSEIERSLDEAVADSPVLPNSFSRADIYIDHD